MKVSLTATPSVARFAPIVVRGDPSEAFALAAELGYDGVELHLRRPDDVDSATVRDLQARYGLGVPTLGTGMAAGEDGLTFSDPDPEIRQQAVARTRAHIALAAKLQSAVTIGLIRGRLGGEAGERATRRANQMECLETCCRDAAAAGVILLLEPVNRYEGDDLFTLAQACGVIEELGQPNLKLLADTYHMNIEEADMAEAIRRAGPHLGHVHLVDSNRRAPGHGHIDMRSILAALLDVGFAGYLSFEVLPLPDGRRAAEDGIATVRRLLAELGACGG